MSGWLGKYILVAIIIPFSKVCTLLIGDVGEGGNLEV